MYHDEPTLPFPAAAFAERVAALRQMMGERGLDLLLLVNPANLYYLTGFGTGSGASVSFLVLPLEGEMVWAMRRTEISNLRLGPADLRPRDAVGVDDSQDVAVVLAELVLERDFPRRRVGVEGEALAFTVSHQMKLGAALPDSDFIDASGLVEGLRAVKSPAELAYMRQAGAITAFAMAAGLDALRDGVTDAEIAAAVLAAALREGSGRMAALPYVVSGPGSARAHSSWCGRRIVRGDIVNVEFASSVARHHVPAFRVLSLGEPSDREIRNLHRASEAGLAAGLRSIRPGMTSDEADRVVREPIERAGYGAEFLVRAAYGIGIAFPPTWGEMGGMSLRPGDERIVEAGMCFHLVPALYKDGCGCVCCSMPIEITERGAQPLCSIEPALLVAR